MKRPWVTAHGFSVHFYITLSLHFSIGIEDGAVEYCQIHAYGLCRLKGLGSLFPQCIASVILWW